MKIKRIAFVTPMYLPAPLFGSDNAVRILAEDFAKFGHAVTVITSDALTPRYWYDPFFGKKIPEHSAEQIHGVRIIRLSSHQVISSAAFVLIKLFRSILPVNIGGKLEILSAGPYFVGLGRVLELGGFDVIHCSPFPLFINAQVVHIVRKLRVKPRVIVTPFFHTEVLTYHNPYLGKIIEKVDCVHTVSNAEKKDIEEIFPHSRGKIEAIPLYLRTAALHSLRQLEKDVHTFKKRHQLVGKKIILFAGLKGDMKGALDTLRAVVKLYKTDPTIRLVSIGHNTNEWDRLKEKLYTPALVDLTYVDEYTKEVVFCSCDVFCMPSKSESFGYVYLEAWHKRKPVIAASIGPVQEVIGKNNAGVLVPYGDVEAIARAMRTLLDDSKRAQHVGENGYQLLGSMYDETKLVRAYRRLFGV